MKQDWFRDNATQDQCGKLYETFAIRGHIYYVRKKTEHLLSFVEKHCGVLDTLSLLDFGCGTGETTTYLEKRFANVHGCDLSESMLNKARFRCTSSHFFTRGDAVQESLVRDIDVACMYGVLHHMASRQEIVDALSYIHGKLASNGLLFIYEFNPWNPAARYIVKTCKVDQGVNLDGFHKNVFPTTLFHHEINSLLEHSSYKIVTNEFILIFPNTMRWLAFLEPLFRRLPLGNMSVTVATKR